MESRMEAYLNAAISGNTENLPKPISRIDFLLCELIKTLGESGASIEEVEKIVTDKVAEIVADAPKDFDTLKELSDWIYTHEESAAAMNTAIQSNTNSIESLMTDVNKKANSDDVYDKATTDSRFLGIDATADKAVADENGSNISETFSDVKNDIALNRTTLGTQCKNLLKNNAVTTTINGVTFTVNDDKSITVTGKANDSTKQTIFIFANNSTLKKTIKPGKYILSGCPSGGSSSTYRMFAYHINPSTNIADDGNGVTGDFDYSNTTDSNIAIVIAKGYADNINLTFYPMLRYADITDDTYEPYKESVDERLTKNKSDIAVNKTTLGYRCKNLLKNTAKSTSYSDVQFTVNSDGTVDVSSITTSTATRFLVIDTLTLDSGSYVLTGADDLADYGDIRVYVDSDVYQCNTPFTITESKTVVVRICVYTNRTLPNTIRVYPMLRYAEITDSSYEPYKENVDERLIENKSNAAVNRSTLGYQCKNLLKNNVVTKTVSGVTFTINDDKSITVNGTATAQISFMINDKVGLGIGNYILAGCPSGGSWNTFYLTAYASSAWLKSPDFGSGCKIENKTVTQVVISIASGYTANNLKFHPMLRYADITDDTYEPYQPSLYEQIVALEERIAALEV